MRFEEFNSKNDSLLFEISNLQKKNTGLPVNIYVSSGGSVNHQHGPRIKAMITSSEKMDINSTVSVLLKKDITADDVVGYHKLPTDILNSLRKYINANYEVLIAYWNDEIDSVELVQKLKKI
jgi:hypothetical protein